MLPIWIGPTEGVIFKENGYICFKYRTGANKGRGLYSKKIFWAILAANNQERLIFENYFSHQFSLVRLT